MAQVGSGSTDGFGDELGGNCTPFSVSDITHSAQRCLGWSTVLAKVSDAVDNADDGAGIGVAGPSVADDLATDTVFLGSEREGDERDAVQVGEGTREQVKAILANEQLHVAQTERVACTRTAVLAGAEEPKERHVAQVRHGQADMIAVEGGQLANIVKDGEWKRFDSRRRRVLLGVAAKLSVKSEVG